MKLGRLIWGPVAAALLAIPAVAAASMDLAGSAAGQSAPSAAPDAAASDGAAAKGKQVFEETCGACHDLAVSTGQMKSRDDWQATVSRMENEGAPITDEQAAQVVAYLSKNFGAR